MLEVRCDADICKLTASAQPIYREYYVHGNSNFNHCLFIELPSAASRVRHTLAAAAAHPLEFEVSRCRTSQFARYVLPAQVRIWNDLPNTEFDTGTLDGFKGAVNRWLLPGVVFSFSVAQMLVGLRKQFINNFDFQTWACAAGFYNPMSSLD